MPPEAQAAIRALLETLERRIADLEERLNKNSTNSSKPPSSDPPSVKRRPPAPPSGKKRGGQPGHRQSPAGPGPARTTPAGHRVQAARACRCCGHDLHGDDPEPLRHQVAEVPPIEPTVDEYRLHRLSCPRCGTSTCATLPPGVPTGAFGPRLRAILSVLAGAYRLGKRPIRRLASDLLGPVDLHRDDRPAGAAGRRRVGGPGRGARPSTSATPTRPTSTRRRGSRAGTRRGSGWP